MDDKCSDGKRMNVELIIDLDISYMCQPICRQGITFCESNTLLFGFSAYQLF